MGTNENSSYFEASLHMIKKTKNKTHGIDMYICSCGILTNLLVLTVLLKRYREIKTSYTFLLIVLTITDWVSEIGYIMTDIMQIRNSYWLEYPYIVKVFWSGGTEAVYAFTSWIITIISLDR